MSPHFTSIKKVTINDVAREAGVSIKTVSRVVNGEAAVRANTRTHVQAVIDRLGYQPDISARRMGGHRTFQIGLIYLRVRSLYFLDVQQGLLDMCRQRHYGVTLCPIEMDEEHVSELVEQSFQRLRPDGVVLTPPFSGSAQLQESLKQWGIPFACIAPPSTHDHPISVFSRDRSAAKTLTEYLIELGHRDIALVAGHPDHSASHEREAGVIDALTEAGLTLPKRLRVQGFFQFQDGVDASEQLLSLSKRPTAIICANDAMAAGVLHSAIRKHVRVPEDLSITGFDDADTARQTLPQLTTIAQPVQEMAHEAGRLLLNHLSDSKAEISPVGFDCQLIVRDSTGPCTDPVKKKRAPKT